MTYHSPSPQPFPLTPDLYEVPVALRWRAREWSTDALVRNVALIRDCVAVAQCRWQFEIEAAVVLPNEMQMLARFRAGEIGIRQAAALIQTTFERHVEGDWCGWEGPADLSPVDHSAVPLRRVFIEAAPVRLGLVDDPADWAYSSVQRKAVQAGRLGVAVA